MPPVTQAIGISVKEVTPGHVTFLLDAPEFLTNHLGFVAGGILATALDSALGCAALSALDAALDIVTLDLTIDFLRPTHYGAGTLTIDADAVYVGRNRSLSTGRITGPDGKLVASGKSNCLIRAKQNT